MAHQSNLIESDILSYLKAQEHKSLLRFITCGSVDDGKSTLIGRLLYESKLIYEDQLAALEKDSKKVGTQGEDIDFALLVDGLASEREQGITIDVAYRYFSTDKRKFIVADTPGHEQYTRNMATGASTAELAILMVDARHGIMTQTRRHSTIVHLLGVKKIVLAINKMDLVDYDEATYKKIVADYQTFAQDIGIHEFKAIPVSALKGDNITERSQNMNWYDGVSLIEYLETVSLNTVKSDTPFSMPVQWVNRPNLDFRGFAGQVATGALNVGDPIKVLPSGAISSVKSIITFENELTRAVSGESITLTLNDEIDISRGVVLVARDSNVNVGNRFLTTLLWMSDDRLIPGKAYWIKTRAKLFSGKIESPNYKLNVNTLEKHDTDDLGLNEIGQTICEFDQDIAFEPYKDNAHLGSFIIIDRHTNNTVGMGLIESNVGEQTWAERHVAERNKYWVKGQVANIDRVEKFQHKPLLLILTGDVARSDYFNVGTTIEKTLFENNINAYRYGFQFLRFSNSDEVSVSQLREEMVRQLLDIGYAFLDAGMVFITAIQGLTTSELNQLSVISNPYNVMVLDLKKESEVSNLVWSKDNSEFVFDSIYKQINV
ncbi:MAG: sulfate adenylyltransferase subunit CysN [Candidatus Margulisiibacteriota bacterium]|nr:sulfate adenylyltransferase subunit CysN [Candidatus Margulisiibacteriota bacterium]